MADTSEAGLRIGVFVDGWNQERSILLVQRGPSPDTAQWDIPETLLAPGESAEAAAQRALKEQTGLDAGPLWAVFRGGAARGEGDIPLLFEATLPSGTLGPGSGIIACRWFSPSELPEDFVSNEKKALVRRWAAARWGHGLGLGMLKDALEVEGADLVTGFWPPLTGSGLPPGTTPEGPGVWRIEDGAVSVSLDVTGPSALWFDAWVDGDQLIVFAAKTVFPHNHDINCIWEGSGSFKGEDDRLTVGGAGGWYKNLAGIEYYPSTPLAPRPTASTALIPIVAEQVYYLAAGRCGSVDFLFVDGLLVMEVDGASLERRLRSRLALSTFGTDEGGSMGAHVCYLAAWVYRIMRASIAMSDDARRI